MPPPLTPQDEEEERRRLLESVDYAALDGLAGATSPVTQQAPPASRDDGVIRPFAEPITIGPTQPTPAERVEPAAAPAMRPATPAAPAADAWIDPRSSTAPGRSHEDWPDTPGSRRHGSFIVYPPGSLPLPPRAQAIEERLHNGEADDIVAEMDAELAALPPIPPQEAPISPLAPRSSPETNEPEPEPEFHDPDVEERAMAELSGEDMSAQPPVELASLRPRAAALGSPVATPPDEPEDAAVEKPEGIDKEGPQGLIPGEDELASARAGDIPRRLLHNLANAFRAMGGRPANREFVRDEDRVRAQQRQMLGDKRTALGDERRTNEQAMTRALQQRQMDQRDEHQRSQLELASRNADRQDQMSQAQMSRLLEQTETERADRERAERLTDPASPESARSRTVLEGLVSSLPAGDRARVTEALGRSEDGQTLAIDGLSAQDLESLREDMPRYLRNGLRAGRGNEGGGGGGGGQTAAQLRSAIVDRIAGPSATPEQRATAEREAGAMISALGIRRAASTVLTDALSRTRSDEAAARQDERAAATRERQARGPELIPGSGIRAGGDLATGEDARWRDGYAHALSNMSSFRRVRSIADRFGRTGAINPEARAAINPELTLLRGMVAQMGNTGVINPSEVPTINAALPNPSDPEQATFETFIPRLTQWLSIVEDNVRARATTLGVDQAGIQRLIQGLRTGRIPRPAPAAGEARVLMIFPNGQRGRVPESQVQAAIDSRGARRAE